MASSSSISGPSTSSTYQHVTPCPEKRKPELDRLAKIIINSINDIVGPVYNLNDLPYRQLTLRNIYANQEEMNGYYDRVYSEILKTQSSTESSSSGAGVKKKVTFDPSSPKRHDMDSKIKGRDYRKGLAKTQLPVDPKVHYDKEIRSRDYCGSEDGPPAARVSLNLDSENAELVTNLHHSVQARYEQKYLSARDLFEEYSVIVYTGKIPESGSDLLQLRIQTTFSGWTITADTPVPPSKTGWKLDDHHSHARLAST